MHALLGFQAPSWGAIAAVVATAALLQLLCSRGRRALQSVASRAVGLPDGSPRESAGGRPRLLGLAARAASGLLLVLAALAWLAVVFAVSEEFAALMVARDSAIWSLARALTQPLVRIGERSVSLAQVLELPLLLAAVWVAAGLLARLVQSRLARARNGAPGAAESVGFLLRYTLVLAGGVLALQAWGVDVSSLALLASVLGVGIGFGLQNLANNFVSGIVLSLERPVRVGDFVQVGELKGSVEQITARSTRIRTRDNLAIVVPNSRLLESEVINWTLGDPRTRLHVQVGVAYGTDLRLARAVLLRAAQGHPGVLREPAPKVDMDGFGDSALQLDLEVWTADPRRQDDLISDLYYRIDRRLRRHGIVVPFPQRDVHVVLQREQGGRPTEA